LLEVVARTVSRGGGAEAAWVGWATTAGNASYGTVDYQIDCVARGLMYSQLIFRAERQQKIPKKGHKLLKFPKRLEPHPVREYTHTVAVPERPLLS
jgi:hypothetical protein